MNAPFILFDSGPRGGTTAFARPETLIVAWEPEEVAPALAELATTQAQGKWLAGYASYELGYILEPKLLPRLPEGRKAPLLCFGVFDGPDKDATQKLSFQAKAELRRARLSPPKPQWSRLEYRARFDQVKEYIGAGDIYQANLTFPMQAKYEGSPLGLYAALQQAQPVKHGSLVSLGQGPVIISRSPELFFSVDGDGAIETRPMKGTAPRGDTPQEDFALSDALRNDPKNRAENLMIVDLLRNDISRLAELGSVKVPELFTVEQYTTVHQMVSLVRAQLTPKINLPDLLQALFPCGSITGAPKVRAMEILSELEPEPRDIYCGSIGWMAPDGTASFNVAIRTLSLFEDNVVHLNVGGGVVFDSTAESEYEEALWKARYTALTLPDILS